jgi:hypothetical protein
MTTITGSFSNRADAEAAVTALEARGITPSEISLILSDAAHQKIFNDNVSNAERASSSVKGAGNGAVLGGTLGGIIAGLTTVVGLVAIPGFGILAAGPIVAILAGAGAGAATGTVAGALVGAGIPDAEANEYEKHLRSGKALVTVYTDSANKASAARDVLMSYNSFYKAA